MGLKSDDACLQKVADDEPIFVLRAQDKLAPVMVHIWAELAALHGCSDAKIDEAANLAMRMQAWAIDNTSKWPD